MGEGMREYCGCGGRVGYFCDNATGANFLEWASNATRAERRMFWSATDLQPQGGHHNEAQPDSRQPAQIGSRGASKSKRICLFCGLLTSIFFKHSIGKELILTMLCIRESEGKGSPHARKTASTGSNLFARHQLFLDFFIKSKRFFNASGPFFRDRQATAGCPASQKDIFRQGIGNSFPYRMDTLDAEELSK